MRIFTCHECGHKMRVAGDECGRCNAPKPILKKGSLYLASLFVSLVAVSMTLAASALTRI